MDGGLESTGRKEARRLLSSDGGEARASNINDFHGEERGRRRRLEGNKQLIWLFRIQHDSFDLVKTRREVQRSFSWKNPWSRRTKTAAIRDNRSF